MKKNDTPLSGKEKAEKLNEELEFAASKLKAGSNDIQMWLDPLLRNLSSDPSKPIKPGDSTQYFEVSNKWDGDYRTLFQYVTFKDIPNNSKVEAYIDQIETNEATEKYMTPEAYAKYEEEYRTQAYNTLTSNLSLQHADMLEEIMNSSAMWRVATVSTYDSDQNKKQWVEIYHDMEQILDEDDDLFAWVIQQIENEKHTASWIINAIDDEFKKMMAAKHPEKGKDKKPRYSHRLHKWYK